jgi:hypothetical protein
MLLGLGELAEAAVCFFAELLESGIGLALVAGQEDLYGEQLAEIGTEPGMLLVYAGNGVVVPLLPGGRVALHVEQGFDTACQAGIGLGEPFESALDAVEAVSVWGLWLRVHCVPSAAEGGD